MTKTCKPKLIRVGSAKRLTRGIEGVGLEMPAFKREEG
jgi:hypothetical protein